MKTFTDNHMSAIILWTVCVTVDNRIIDIKVLMLISEVLISEVLIAMSPLNSESPHYQCTYACINVLIYYIIRKLSFELDKSQKMLIHVFM